MRRLGFLNVNNYCCTKGYELILFTTNMPATESGMAAESGKGGLFDQTLCPLPVCHMQEQTHKRTLF